MTRSEHRAQLAVNATKRRHAREQLRAIGRCVNDSLSRLKHAEAVKGGRCAKCWIKKTNKGKA